MRKVFFNLMFFSIILQFFSCKVNYDEEVKGYFEYWSETVIVGRYQAVSDYAVIDGDANLSAADSIKVNIYIANPQQYNLALANDDQAYFSVLNEDEEDVALSKSAELSSDKNIITVTAELSDDTEKENLTIKGLYYILKGENQDATGSGYYQWTFRQNTPPDSPTNLSNPTSVGSSGYHEVSFEYPDQSLKRNLDLSYKISCYLLENNSFTYIGTKTLTSADSLSQSNFTYYFPEQTASLQYDYVVTSINPDGLTSQTVSTDPGLGVCYVTEPEVTFDSNGDYNGLTAESGDNEYDVVEYSGDSLGYTVTNTCEGSDMTVKINGETASANGTFVDEGFYQIEVTIEKNLCLPVTTTKYVYIAKELDEAQITFYSDGEKNNEVSEGEIENTSYSSYNSYDVDLDEDGNAVLYYKAEASGTGEELVVTYGAEESSIDAEGSLDLGPHTITMKVSKEYHTDKSVTKNIYVQGILSDPTFDFTNGSEDGESDGYEIYKFSYISFDTLNYTISLGNSGNTMTVKQNGSVIQDESQQNYSGSMDPDKKNTIVVTQTRDYCKTNTYTKKIQSAIKSITLTYQNQGGKGSLDVYLNYFGADKWDLKGQFYINDNTLFAYENSNYNNVYQDRWQNLNDSDARNVSMTFTSPSDTLTLKIENLRRNKGGGGADLRLVDEGTSVTRDRSLKQVKKGISESEETCGYTWTFFCDTITGNNGRSVQPRVQFSVSE